jgi:hypothetical protein
MAVSPEAAIYFLLPVPPGVRICVCIRFIMPDIAPVCGILPADVSITSESSITMNE